MWYYGHNNNMPCYMHETRVKEKLGTALNQLQIWPMCIALVHVYITDGVCVIPYCSSRVEKSHVRKIKKKGQRQVKKNSVNTCMHACCAEG